MPPPAQTAIFERNALQRLQSPITDYFNIVSLYGADSLNARIAERATALTMDRTLAALHTEAARLGVAPERLTAEQQDILRLFIMNDQAYMKSFMSDLPKMSKSVALNRCRYYVTTIMHTLAEFESYGLPLPIRPGDRVGLICQWHCKCSLDVRKVAGGYDVYWRRSARESCASCKALERAWNPLRIRRGKVEAGQSLTTMSQIRAIKGLVAMLTTQPNTKVLAARLLTQWSEVA